MTFQAAPYFDQIAMDSSSVFGYYSSNNSRVHFHNITIPQLYNQDLALKNLIDNLASRMATVENSQSTNAAGSSTSDKEHPLTYLCWAWTLLSMLLLLVFLIYKIWKGKQEVQAKPSLQNATENNLVTELQPQPLKRTRVRKRQPTISLEKLEQHFAVQKDQTIIRITQ